MKKHIKDIIDQYGKSIITEKKLVFLLDDNNAFKDVERSIRHILMDVIELGYAEQLTKETEWGLHAQSICQHYINKTGVQETYAIFVFNCLAYGLGIKKISEQESKQKSQNNFVKLQSHNVHIITKRYDLQDRCIWQKSKDTAQGAMITNFKIRRGHNVFIPSLTFNFCIRPNNPSIGNYHFNYVIKDKNRKVIEQDSVELANIDIDCRTIEDCALNINAEEIDTIQYYLTIS